MIKDRSERGSMIRKYVFGDPIETDAVVREIGESCWSDGLLRKKGNAFYYELQPDEIVRIVAMFRYINPTAYIRIAAGRSYFEDGGEVLFRSGANATLTGDMLTTIGNNTAQDRAMLSRMGFELKEAKENE